MNPKLTLLDWINLDAPGVARPPFLVLGSKEECESSIQIARAIKYLYASGDPPSHISLNVRLFGSEFGNFVPIEPSP